MAGILGAANITGFGVCVVTGKKGGKRGLSSARTPRFPPRCYRMIFKKPKKTTRVEDNYGQVTDSSSEQEKQIDFTLARESWIVEDHEAAKVCPRCRAGLQASYQSYALLTKVGSEAQDSFLVGTDRLGFYCPQCPTVVLVASEMRHTLAKSLPHWRVGSEVLVLGIANWDDQANLESDSEEVPKIVPFYAPQTLKPSNPKRAKSRPAPKKKKRPRPRSRP